MEEYAADPEKVRINREQFPFAIGIEDPITYLEYIDDSIFTVTATWTRIKKILNNATNQYEAKWEIIELKTEPCTLEHFKQQDTKYFFHQISAINNKICIAIEEYEKYGGFYTQGDFNSFNYAFLKFQFFQCQE